MPPTTIKTVILAPTNLSPGGFTGINLTNTDLQGYAGAFFWMQGQGGTGYNDNGLVLGGTSGYINSGYIDFEYPYVVDSLYLQTQKTEGNYQTDPCSKVQITYAPGSGAPIDNNTGVEAVVFHGANKGFMYDSTSPPYSQGDGYYIGGADFGGGYVPANSVVITQLGTITVGSGGPTIIQATGGVTPVFGYTDSNFYGGGGYYGDNPTVGCTGFSSGGGVTGGSFTYRNENFSGFVVVSLIPSSMAPNPQFIDNGATGVTGTNSMYLYQALGGGSAGGGYSSNNGNGGGGGGSGYYKNGFFNVKLNSTINCTPGIGGFFFLQNGTPSIISYSYSNNIYNINASNGSSQVNNGGAGFFSGGGGSNTAIAPISQNPTLIPCNSQSSNFNSFTSMNGGGYIGIPYPGSPGYFFAGGITTSSPVAGFGVGGGGGGWYGGYGGGYDASGPSLITWNGANALGYGCGGGGSCGILPEVSPNVGAGNGSGGYVLLREFNPGSNATLFRITSTKTIAPELVGNSGVWIFLAADNGLDALSTLHFSIPDDGLKRIDVTYNNQIYTVSCKFKPLNGYQQTVTRSSLTPQRFINILIYK